MKNLARGVLGLAGVVFFLAAPAHAQLPVPPIELKCPSGYDVLPGHQTFNASTQQFRQNVCVDVNGNVIQNPNGTNAAIKPAASDAVQYVSVNGNDANDGLSWGSAKGNADFGIAIASAFTALPASGGIVYIAGGTFPTATNFTVPSNVCVIGSGRNSTILSITSNLNVAEFLPGTKHACFRDIGMTFSTSAENSAGLRISASDASPTELNDFENLAFTFPAASGNSSTGLGIYATSSGPSNTDVVLNTFRNIVVSNANQFAQCQGCEGNFWSQVQGFQIGQNASAIMFQETSPNADEIVEARMESGSTQPASTVCYSTTGSNNLVRLTCDAGAASVTAVNDTGSNNVFDVDTVGTPTLGTIPSTSQYRYVDSNAGDNKLSVKTLALPSSGGGTITHQAPNTASSITVTEPVATTPTPVAGTCTMSTTTCTITVVSGAAHCVATDSGGTIAGQCAIAGTTLTVTAASSNTSTWSVLWW